MKSFSGKVAAITGAGSGIGCALALRLAQQGCHLALCDVDEKTLADTIELAGAGCGGRPREVRQAARHRR